MSTSSDPQTAAATSSKAVSTPDKWPSRNSFQRLVTLFVGSEKKAYVLHKDILCFYSDYFRAALNGSFLEAAELKIELPDVDKDVFERFQLWLYTRQIERDELTAVSLVHLWIFGDAHQVPLLQNCVMDELFNKRARDKAMASSVIKPIYENTLEGSPLRKAVIEMIAHKQSLAKPHEGLFTIQEHWTVESLVDVVNVVDAARRNKLEMFVLPKRDKCFFHVHGKDEHC